MATAEQLKALVRSYIDRDDDRFTAVSMQVAAQAAKKGQERLAKELRDLIDKAKVTRSSAKQKYAVPITKPKGDLSELLVVNYSQTRLNEMVLPAATRTRLVQIVREYRQQAKLRSHGLSSRRKLLLIGPPGSGKTMTASALAGELKLPLLCVQLHAVMTKYMGETAAKLKMIFDAMNETRGVYLFDEFDAIGSNRGMTNDVGEIRRVLNSFLQFLEQDDTDSLILAATNHFSMLDPALHRRFDDVIRYEFPDPELSKELMENRLAVFGTKRLDWGSIKNAAEGLSFAELARACDDAARKMVLEDRGDISQDDLVQALIERKSMSTST